MKKKVLASVLTAVLAVSVLSACGASGSEDTAAATQETTEEAAEAASEPAEEAAEAESAPAEETEAADGDLTVISVAASATPHAEILEAAKPLLAAEGYDLEVTVFDDYVQPNMVVDSGEFDANYFQHIPYLENFNVERGTDLVIAGKIHYEPFGIYPGTKSSLDDLEEGDTIAVPNDTTNEARALLLLQDNGVLTLKDGAGLEATVNDITENPKNLQFQELEAAQIPHVIGEVALAVMNGNYALDAGYSVSKDAIAYEKSDSDAAQTYVNVIAVKAGNEENAGIQALVSVLKSDDIRNFINETYDGAVIPYDGE
ncbi:MAG: MetQ/NlpA family ABC transporter substrate-binding protein [Eubacteriales bacterium]|nr:MetQ/NlpA family ABC transporter substrate-binding protein [Eubacteriales bacterium]